MITEEQLSIVEDEYNKYLPTGFCDINAMRKALENYEVSKWKRFSVDDESTLRELSNLFYVNGKALIHSKYGVYIAEDLDDLKASTGMWQPLPEFKE